MTDLSASYTCETVAQAREPAAHVAGDAFESIVRDLVGDTFESLERDPANPGAGMIHFSDGLTLPLAEIERVVPCFVPGTAIATPKGEVMVEDLRAGDRVITRDNGIQQIVWTGTKRVSNNQITTFPELRAIAIKAGAMGNGMPERDLLVSPTHRMLIVSDLAKKHFGETEVLVAAKHMLAMDGVEVSIAPYLTYIHFMCERHEIVLSNGAWSESFQPNDFSLKGLDTDRRKELVALFPEFERRAGIASYKPARIDLNPAQAAQLVSA